MLVGWTSVRPRRRLTAAAAAWRSLGEKKTTGISTMPVTSPVMDASVDLKDRQIVLESTSRTGATTYWVPAGSPAPACSLSLVFQTSCAAPRYSNLHRKSLVSTGRFGLSKVTRKYSG